MVPRVRALPVLLLTALLILPSVAAFVAPDPFHVARGEGMTSEATNAEGITWFAPDSVQVGHPVHAAVAVLTGSGYATSMHQNLEVWVTLNDAVILHTPSIHEHHGLHVLTVTPMEPGVLRLYAGEPGAAHEHFSAGLGRAAALEPPGPQGIQHEVRVDGPEIHVADLTRMSAALQRDGPGWQVKTDPGDIPATALLTLEDELGRLLASSWVATRDGIAHYSAHAPGVSALDAILTPHPASNETLYAEHLRLKDTTLGLGKTVIVPPSPMTPTCDGGERRLVLDPDSLNAEVPTWQQWSDVRAHLLDGQRLAEAEPEPLLYLILPLPLRTSEHAAYTIEAADPFGFASFRMTQPGLHSLVVAESRSGTLLCHTFFMVTAGPGALAADGPGHLEVSIHESDGGAHVELASRLPDGGQLPHYEFDTRIVRVADENGPAFLAWRGKLHGHQGEVSFQVANLPAGTYEMRVYPSPQDAELRPLAADGDGFVHTFTVTASEIDAPQLADEMETAPAPVALLVVLLGALGGLLARRRHRTR